MGRVKAQGTAYLLAHLADQLGEGGILRRENGAVALPFQMLTLCGAVGHAQGVGGVDQ